MIQPFPHVSGERRRLSARVSPDYGRPYVFESHPDMINGDLPCTAWVQRARFPMPPANILARIWQWLWVVFAIAPAERAEVLAVNAIIAGVNPRAALARADIYEMTSYERWRLGQWPRRRFAVFKRWTLGRFRATEAVVTAALKWFRKPNKFGAPRRKQ